MIEGVLSGIVKLSFKKVSSLPSVFITTVFLSQYFITNHNHQY